MSTTNNINSALKKGLESVTQKYSQASWDAVEKVISDFDKNVLRMLADTTVNKDTSSINCEKIKVLGNDLYNLVRDLIIKELSDKQIIIIDDKNKKEDKKNTKKKEKKKKKKQNIKKSDMIRLENAKKSSYNSIKSVLSTFSKKTLTPYNAFRSDILEVRALGLMYCLWYVCNNKKKLSKEQKTNNYLFVLSIIISSERFLKSCSNYVGKDMITPRKDNTISSLLIEDMTRIYERTKDMYPYDGFTIYEYAPELLIYSEYDKCIPSKGIRPRKNQKDVIEFMRSNFDTGFYLSYKAMISSGKTTCSIALIKYIEHLRKTNEKYKNLQFLFCCNLASVKSQVAQICYNMSVPFGMTHVDKNGLTKIVNNYNCPVDSNRVCIIGSPDAVSNILTDCSKSNIKTNYFLFHDEPTIGADMEDSQALKDNVKVMSNLPKWSILSSATMPDVEYLKLFTDKFLLDNPNGVIGSVYSDEIQIGCDVMTLDYNPVIPHLGCINKVELNKILQTIKKNPFLGRIYTHKVAKTIWTECMKLEIKNVPNIPEIFKHVENLNMDNIRKYVMQMLESLIDQDDSVIQQVCSTFIDLDDKEELSTNDKNKFSDGGFSDDGFAWETESIEKEEDDNNVNYTKLGTTQAYKFLNMNLVATIDPFKFTLDNFKDLLTELKNNKECPIHSANSMLTKYEKELSIYKSNCDRVLKKVDNEDKQSKELDKLRSNKPTIKFPKFGHINTKKHIMKFSPHKLKSINSRFIREELLLENIPFDKINVPDDIILLLFCGVGIYSPNSNIIDSNYTQVVLDLAESGSLAYLVADSSICYGTNYPINRVFVVEDFSKNHSIYTLFQLMGRAGRVGRSWKAEAFVHESCSKEILKYTRDPNSYNTEGENMIKVFNKIKQDKDDEILAEIKKMEDKLIRDMANSKNTKTNIVKENKLKKAKIDDIMKPSNKPAWKESTNWREQRTLNTHHTNTSRTSNRNKKVNVRNNNTYIPPHQRKNTHNNNNNNDKNDKPLSWRRK
jgi:hypothetical protein